MSHVCVGCPFSPFWGLLSKGHFHFSSHQKLLYVCRIDFSFSFFFLVAFYLCCWHLIGSRERVRGRGCRLGSLCLIALGVAMYQSEFDKGLTLTSKSSQIKTQMGWQSKNVQRIWKGYVRTWYMETEFVKILKKMHFLFKVNIKKTKNIQQLCFFNLFEIYDTILQSFFSTKI